MRFSSFHDMISMYMHIGYYRRMMLSFTFKVRNFQRRGEVDETKEGGALKGTFWEKYMCIHVINMYKQKKKPNKYISCNCFTL